MNERTGLDRARESFAKAADEIGTLARTTSAHLTEQADGLKNSAVDKIGARHLHSYEELTVEYNGAFTAMSDKGMSLLRQRERSTDLIGLVELLLNSIANTPKSFGVDFEEIDLHRAEFLGEEEFARQDLAAARKSATGAGVGVTAGTAIVGVAPTAAIWVATTFGTASTGAAISTLSGAAASQAALAWLGGGALAAGGGGTAAGGALLALAGPVGWTVAGAALLTSVALFTKKKFETREARKQTITALQYNVAHVRRIDAQIGELLQRTTSMRELLMTAYSDAVPMFGVDFRSLNVSQQSQLAALVNNTRTCAALLSRRVDQDPVGE
jgi:hypothetical protein